MKNLNFKKIASYALNIGFLIAIIWLVGLWQSRNLLSDDSTAPDFTAIDLNGNQFTLSAQKGKKTILYFFAPWCSVCKLNIDNLNEFTGITDVSAIAIGLGYNNKKEIETFARKYELKVPVIPGTESIENLYRIQSYPTIYIIDENGIIYDKTVGYTTNLGLYFRLL
jgi:peroxiredoxin